MKIEMPKLGLTMTEGTLTRWLKAAGQPVSQGEILFEFESEKSALEFECPATGVLTQQLVAEGQTVLCGTPVAVLETTPTGYQAQGSGGVGEQERTATKLPFPHHQPSALPPHRSTPLVASATPAAKRRARELGVDLAALNGRGPQGRIHLADVEIAARTAAPEPGRKAITPLAKRLAADLAVDWTQISGGGPDERIVKQDIVKAASSPVRLPAPVGVSRVQPLSGVRGVIARRISQSAFTAPHVTLFTEADASALVESRTQLNTELVNRGVKISYNTLLIAIVARALRDYPNLNACLIDEAIHYYADINIALAVDTEAGLLAPVIRQADQLDLVALQQTGDALIQRALSGQSLPDDLTGGTFTITNLGMFEVDGFTPIINQPQAAILGIGRIAPKPVVSPTNELVVRPMVTLSLSFDHRLVDGGPTARFLQRVKGLIERPLALLIPASW
jgi:pyruvate dehydrogenase E2 component (dihydrolipoamide acetyltransferase)